MRRRIDLAMTLVGSPKVICLDEPTTGLDPRSRRTMWQSIRELAAGGTTIFSPPNTWTRPNHAVAASDQQAGEPHRNLPMGSGNRHNHTTILSPSSGRVRSSRIGPATESWSQRRVHHRGDPSAAEATRVGGGRLAPEQWPAFEKRLRELGYGPRAVAHAFRTLGGPGSVAEALEVLRAPMPESHPVALSFEVTETRGGPSPANRVTITAVERHNSAIYVNYDVVPPPDLGSHRARGEARGRSWQRLLRSRRLFRDHREHRQH